MPNGKKHGRAASVRAAFDRVAASAPPPPPPPAPPPPPRGFLPDGRLSDGSGRVYGRVGDAVGPERAVELLAEGAAVVWDDCGCGGYCGLDWVEGERMDRLRRSGRPSMSRVTPKRGQSGWIEEWHAADGAMLLYVAGDVRWGKADRGQP